MAEKISSKRVAYSLALVAGIVYLACAILVAIAPAWTVNFFGALFHGIDISQIARAPVPLASTALGFVEIIVLGYLVGLLFGAIYNKF
ncbi:MAG: DUF5676 family membrane protein [Nanoarchaeota archaeon]